MTRVHGRRTRVWVDGFNLTGDSNGIEVNSTIDPVDVSSFGDERKRYITGQHDVVITHNGLFDDGTALTAAAVLRQRIGSEVIAGVLYGTAGSAFGWAGTAAPLKAHTVASPLAGAVTVSAEYAGPLHPIQLLLGESVAVPGTGVAFDGGAGSNSGAFAALQVATVNGSPAFLVEHSTAVASGYTTLIDLGTATSRTALAREASGTVRQFVRYTQTGGSATAWVGFRRF